MLEPQPTDVGTVDSLAVAREHLLTANGLSLAALDRALGAALSRQLDYADLYLQLTRYETWTVEDGIVKEGAYSIDQGVGVRAVTGERTGFAYSDQLDEESGPNHGLTLREGRSNFKAFGACEREMVPHVMPASQRERYEFRPRQIA